VPYINFSRSYLLIFCDWYLVICFDTADYDHSKHSLVLCHGSKLVSVTGSFLLSIHGSGTLVDDYMFTYLIP